MKGCKIIHINDGDHRTLTNRNYHFAEDFPWAEKMLMLYLNNGYEISQIIPDITPANPRDGLAFYKGGFTVILISENAENAKEIAPQYWEHLNTPNEQSNESE